MCISSVVSEKSSILEASTAFVLLQSLCLLDAPSHLARTSWVSSLQGSTCLLFPRPVLVLQTCPATLGLALLFFSILMQGLKLGSACLHGRHFTERGISSPCLLFIISIVRTFLLLSCQVRSPRTISVCIGVTTQF